MRVDEKEAEIVFISKLQGQNQVQMCFKDDDKKFYRIPLQIESSRHVSVHNQQKK
jgi:hypothetical protein